MPNFYIDRDTLKKALSIPTSTTDNNEFLDGTIEAVSRLIDEHLGFHVYPASGIRYFTAQETMSLNMEYPLTAVDFVQTSSNASLTFDTTMATSGYFMTPYNATEESPKQPWWGVEVNRNNSTTVFPKAYQRATRVQGTWGYYDQRRTSTAVLSTGVNGTALTLEITGASSLHPGQTILIGSERMFVSQTPTSATGANTSQVTVQRGVNGTSGAAHSSGAAIEIYEYPIIDRAALYQSQMDYRAKDAPLGTAGGDPFGTQHVQAPGGLHPFVIRMLAPIRIPVAR